MKNILLVFVLVGLITSCSEQSASNNAEIHSASIISTTNSSANTDVWLESLITETPQEGRELAIKMARKTIGTIQSNSDVKKRLRGEYSEDAELLILSSQVVAIEFQTVAEANNYWR
ncbi:MAG: hexameric tyrosine-coordinated heme protein [Brumimicrobium sp.]